MADARRVLRQVWGYVDFHPAQARALESLLVGRDVLAVFPTGGGKSLCYQVPAMLLDGVTIVVSPLISLMKDQIDALRARGVPARYLNSSLPPGDAEEVLTALAGNELRLLYVSPERFDSEDFTGQVTRARVALLAIDEAHCVSQWGHDFRPAYQRLGRRRQLFPEAPVVAVTATATPRVRRDIVDQLALRNPVVQVGGFDRPNLHWAVSSTRDDTTKLSAALKALRGLRGGSAIVYVSTQDAAAQVARALADAGHNVAPYHAGLAAARRKTVQDAFMAGSLTIVVATNAFGMGIDKPDIRLVLHYTMPATMEALYQEAGRGGRDGASAKSLLLYGANDRMTHEYLIQQAHPTAATIGEVYRTLVQTSDAAGVQPKPTAVISRALKLRSNRSVTAALRILTHAGVIRYTTPERQSLRVTLLATTDQIHEILGAGDRAADRSTLGALWRNIGGEALYGGRAMRRSAVDGLPGGLEGTLQALGRMEADRLLEWNMDQVGTQLVGDPLPVDRLPVDWRALDAARQLEIARLNAVEAYARGQGCRRRALLDYFSDDSHVSCGGCDFCDRLSRRQ
jgi:ATP-dependent DNA helicase RecQ